MKPLPDISYQTVLFLLRQIAPFTPEEAMEKLQAKNMIATRNLIEELVRRQLITRIDFSTVRRPKYRLTHYNKVRLPNTLEECYIPRERPVSMVFLGSEILNNLFKKYVD